MENRKMNALEAYAVKRISLGCAASLSGLTLSEFIDLLHEFNMTLQLDCDDVKSALEYARKAL